jgi:uncharacterized protein
MIGLWKRWRKARKEKRDRERALFHAVWENDMFRVEELLKEGVDIEATDMNCMTPLLHVVRMQRVEMVRFLLEQGANPNCEHLIQSEAEMTALTLASVIEPVSIEILSLLLEHKADPNLTVQGGKSTLYYVTIAGNLEAVKLLIAHGAKVNTPVSHPLAGAAANGHLDIVKVLLEAGASVKGHHAFQYAASQGHIDIIQTLLDAGADINEDAEALTYAVINGHTETVRVLIERGVDVNAIKSTIQPPLAMAEKLGHEEIARMLREAGAKSSRK